MTAGPAAAPDGGTATPGRATIPDRAGRAPEGAGPATEGTGRRIEGSGADALTELLPPEWRSVADPRRFLPRLAKEPGETARIRSLLPRVPTRHDLFLGDARQAGELQPESVHLVLTSPPYWTLKEYPKRDGQLGWLRDYEEFLTQLDRVWERCLRALAPGGRLVCVVGDVCLSRRRNNGRHTVVPLHASICESCRRLGFDNLSPIIWRKIANAAYESGNGAGAFLGKPYEPNAIVKNDIEFILMQRKPGGYRRPGLAAKILSLIPEADHHLWFRQVWDGPPGASTRAHPAPFPLALAERLVRMFSFVGDTVLDPFLGTGTTSLAAARWGRNSIGIEVDPDYFRAASRRIVEQTDTLYGTTAVRTHD